MKGCGSRLGAARPGFCCAYVRRRSDRCGPPPRTPFQPWAQGVSAKPVSVVEGHSTTRVQVTLVVRRRRP